eukprot:SAG11_NODE_6472_length_1306_cov_1.369511_1_plen_54_part_00
MPELQAVHDVVSRAALEEAVGVRGKWKGEALDASRARDVLFERSLRRAARSEL